MSDFKYYYSKGNYEMRALCGCSYNEASDVDKILYSKDPTKKPDSEGWVWWTEKDSKYLKINHNRLQQAVRIMEMRTQVCVSNTLAPGCVYTGSGSWFIDQKERIKAILENRKPDLGRWSFDAQADEAHRKNNNEVISPYKLARWNKYSNPTYNPTYRYDPNAQAISLVKKGTNTPLLSIPINTVDFVDIKSSGPLVTILVTHSNEQLSYYVVNQGKITPEKQNANPACDVSGACQ